MEAPGTAPKAGAAPNVHLLTAMERLFIRLCCEPEGHPYKRIAHRMGIELPTLHPHRRKVFRKLRVPSRTAFVVLVLRLGLASA